MRQFSDKEIALCRQIAEIYRKPIKKGDWYLYDNEIHLWHITHGASDDDRGKPNPTPLWNEYDCLEWLGAEGFTIIQMGEHPDSHEWIMEYHLFDSSKGWVLEGKTATARGDTLLEALLKAVLEILKEKK